MLKFIKLVFGPAYHPVLHKIRMVKLRKEYARSFGRISAVGERIPGERSRIFVDITGIFLNDKGTGIQRVTREISARMTEFRTDFEVVPVFCKDIGYRECATGAEIAVRRGDIFLVLDQAISQQILHATFFERLISENVTVAAFFYDLIPLTNPSLFTKKQARDFRKLFALVIRFPLIICDSESIAAELREYLEARPMIRRNPDLKIDSALLGCDFSHLNTGRSFPANKESPAFLMVSTVEPRKMYAQAVRAFDLLWEKGLTVSLWIVGRPGWNNKKTFRLIERNRRFGTNLLWYKTGIGDDELAALYERCDAVIFASKAEGFGLAVAEGAYFKKPLILRDIPVFREIAGDNAFYFSGESADSLAQKMVEWLELYRDGLAPDSSRITLPTWHDCAGRVLDILTSNCKGGDTAL